MTLIEAALVTKYDQYACTQCAGTGERRNESQNIVDPRATVPCFCDGMGEVWVLKGFDPPWYAGELIEAAP